ncbi:site-2 protease family protein [Patescibacteria group bacterium]|nr:site-2 protease family protein [Patescibacteria group bacterium]
MLLQSLLGEPVMLVAWIMAILVVLTVHEFCHALAGTLLGDSTAKDSGRLTLNPLSHVSWLGFFMLLLVGFGWGKPVPFNPYNLKYQRFGPALVAVAGPLSNLLLAIISALALRLVITYQIVPPENLLVHFLNLLIGLNIVLMAFNLLPIPPLDGSKILFSIISDFRYAHIRDFLEQHGPTILLGVIILDNIIGLNLLSSLFLRLINLVYKIML